MAQASEFGAEGWTEDRLPDLSGKRFVITGGDSGIGFETTRMLGAKGVGVTIISISEDKAERAILGLKTLAPQGEYDFFIADLADLSTVRKAAAEIAKAHPAIDALIMNAGVKRIPRRTLTRDGFEKQFGVNHIGHFVLASALSDCVERAGGRFVSVSSLMHKRASGIRFSDLTFQHHYHPTQAYTQSKLANLVFALELNRRLEAAGAKSRAYACHPGYANTQMHELGLSKLAGPLMRPINKLLYQSPRKAARSTLLCAAGLEAEPGGYYGPTGFHERTGPVGAATMSREARNPEIAAQLWDISQKSTAAEWPVLAKAKEPETAE